ncbi:uncharacterized protein LOC144444831 [Glandiceps talaboti]
MPKTKQRKSRGRRGSELLTRKANKKGGQPLKEPMSGGAPTAILSKITKMYASVADAQKAAGAKKYMRNQFEFYGMQAPTRRAIDKEIFQSSPPLDVVTLRKLLLLLWQQSEREYQHCGADLASKNVKLLSGSNDKERQHSIQCLKSLITTKSWWDTVDALAPTIGQLAKLHPEHLNPILEDWIQADNMWLRRVALIHQLRYKDDTDKDKLFRFCLLRCHEKDFFIRKAIGWALRQYFRHNPSEVKKFVKDNDKCLSTLSKREALKHA